MDQLNFILIKRKIKHGMNCLKIIIVSLIGEIQKKIGTIL